MKYIIGTKFNAPKLKDEKIHIEEIMSNMSIEKEETQIAEFKNKFNDDICRRLIDVQSIIKEVAKNITIFLEDETQNIIGFLIFDINKKTSLIDVKYLCSQFKGNGKVLLDTIKEFAKQANITRIKLTPGLHKKVVEFYENNGFKVEGWNMIYDVTGGKKPRKTRKSQKKNRTTRKMRIRQI